jgi:hypothetical protein
MQPKSDPTNSHGGQQSGTRDQQLLALQSSGPIAGPPRKVTGRSQVARQVLRAEHNETDDEHSVKLKPNTGSSLAGHSSPERARRAAAQRASA